MVEVQAKLPKGSAYLSGDTIECIVTFKNPRHNSHRNRSHSHSEAAENLAWASVQLYCQCSVDETKVKYPFSSSVEELATASENTSFIPSKGDRGHVVLSTKPQILFCDLRLLPGESRSFVYRDTIPSECPPSFRGQAVKYVYKLTIGTQRVNAMIKLLRIPIRVLPLPGVAELQFCNGSEEQVAPSNPFLQSIHKESPLDLALQFLENITARRTPKFYNITNQSGQVVRFCLLKSAYRLGEDILGTFDFSKASVPCIQFSVTLQSEEEVNEGCVAQSKPLPTVAYSKCHEFCLNLMHTNVLLPIPLNATPDFSTDIVSLSWKLHFEFVTATSPVQGIVTQSKSFESVTVQGPSELQIQTMVWDLPIKIYATHPHHIAHSVQNPCSNSLILTI